MSSLKEDLVKVVDVKDFKFDPDIRNDESFVYCGACGISSKDYNVLAFKKKLCTECQLRQKKILHSQHNFCCKCKTFLDKSTYRKNDYFEERIKDEVDYEEDDFDEYCRISKYLCYYCKDKPGGKVRRLLHVRKDNGLQIRIVCGDKIIQESDIYFEVENLGGLMDKFCEDVL